MAQANIKAVITAEDRASSALRGFGNQVDSVGKSIGKIAKRAAIATLALGGAVAAFGVKAVKAYAESENTLAQLNATLKATKGVAGVTAKSATELATSLQRVTRFSDETVLGGENLLLTFTNIGKDIFPRATKAMLDMSTTMGQDVRQSAIQLGKALQSPMAGMAALSRTGALNRDDMDRLKAKWERVGTPVYKQQIELLQALEKQFKGSSEAAGKTFAGRLDILKNSMNDMQEAIGKTIVVALGPFAQKIADFVNSEKFQAWLQRLSEWLEVNIPRAVKYLTEEVWPFLVQAFTTISPFIETVLELFKGLFGFIKDNTWIIWAAVTAWGAFKVAMILDATAKSVTRNLATIRGAIALTSGDLKGLSKFMTSKATLASWGIFAGAAIVAFKLIQNAAFKTIDAIEGASMAASSAGVGADIQIRDLQKKAAAARKRGDTAAVERYANAIRAFGNIPRQHGGPVSTGQSYLVGERGPELFTPKQSGQITANNKLGSTINLNVNVGIYAGTEVEKRKLAKQLFDAYKDLADSRGTSVGQMIGM